MLEKTLEFHGKPVVKFNDYDLLFAATRYTDGNLAIICETTIGEPYATVSVNLSDYGKSTDDTGFYLSHSLTHDFRNLVIDLFAEETKRTSYGYVKDGLYIKMKDYIIKQIKENLK